MPDYSKSKVYGLYNSITGELFYVGSTTLSLSQRMASHRSDYRNKKGLKKTNYIEAIGLENVNIKLIEDYPCDRKEQLLRREGEKQRETGVLDIGNIQMAGRTDAEYSKEYKKNNRELCAIIDKRYYENNKERLQEKRKEKFECECGGTYSRSDKAKHFKTIKHTNYLNSLEENKN